MPASGGETPVTSPFPLPAPSRIMRRMRCRLLRRVRWAAGVLERAFLATLALRGASSLGRPRRRGARPQDPPALQPAAPPRPRAPRRRRRPPGVVPLHIHVRGTAELHAVATAEHDDLTIHGELIDDAGTPVPGAHITVQATGADDPRAAPRVGPLRPCDDAGGAPRTRGGPTTPGSRPTSAAASASWAARPRPRWRSSCASAAPSCTTPSSSRCRSRRRRRTCCAPSSASSRRRRASISTASRSP